MSSCNKHYEWRQIHIRLCPERSRIHHPRLRNQDCQASFCIVDCFHLHWHCIGSGLTWSFGRCFFHLREKSKFHNTVNVSWREHFISKLTYIRFWPKINPNVGWSVQLQMQIAIFFRYNYSAKSLLGLCSVYFLMFQLWVFSYISIWLYNFNSTLGHCTVCLRTACFAMFSNKELLFTSDPDWVTFVLDIRIREVRNRDSMLTTRISHDGEVICSFH